MSERPQVLIEEWLPVTELGIESRRESAPIPGQFPKIKTLHVWWARRPLVASAGAVLGSVMPVWREHLSENFPKARELATEESYKAWFLRLCGILGDPVAARERIAIATAEGITLGAKAYGYRQAFKNSPPSTDLALLHDVLVATWGKLPSIIDPTAGGGSIPYEAIRYGLSAVANDLNPIAASVLRVGLETPAQYGAVLAKDLSKYGEKLVVRMRKRLEPYFNLPDESDNNSYLFARSVKCPRTGKPVPLAPNWWLSKGKSNAAVRMVTVRNGQTLNAPEFEIVQGEAIDFDPSDGTVSRGNAISPWDGLAIPGDYIKAEAQAGRMGSILYAVATRIDRKRGFRAPTDTDLYSLSAADEELNRLLPKWAEDDVLPIEDVPLGNDSRPHQYGMSRWRDMFSPRQLLVHGTFVEEFRRLRTEIIADAGDADKATAILALLGTMQGKAVNWNSYLSSWDVGRQKLRSVFDRHDFAFKWTYAEFEGARELTPWTLAQLVDAYIEISELLNPADKGSKFSANIRYPVPGHIVVTQGNAGKLDSVETASQTVVCIDPPYYDNVMYAELSDYFYVWEKRTIGLIWPDFFQEDLTDKKNEAVANPARFRSAGRRRNELATADYEAKMTAIFSEAHRVLQDDGVLTVMFTHKKAEAWDTLGTSLMDAGFTIETSWPVPTESDVSLHQAKKNAAASTIFLVCRKRANHDETIVFFEDIEGEVRAAAREALERFTSFGIDGVDLLLSTYGPALSVISSHWPVYSSEADSLTGDNRILRPEEALDTAREELVRLQRQRLVGRTAQLDDLTDFTLLAWEIFKAREFPFDEARRLALAVGGMDVDELERARILTKKSGTVVLLEPSQRVRRRSDTGTALPGVQVDATAFEHLIDAVHTAMHLTSQDGPAAAKQWLDHIGLAKEARFLAAVQGLLNAIPRTRKKEAWLVPEAGWLDELAVFLEGVDVPVTEQRDEEEQSGLWDDDEDGEE